MPIMFKKNLWLILGCFDVVIILFLSLISAQTLKKFSWTDIIGVDKIGHFTFYAAAAGCFTWHYKINRSKNSYLWIWILLFVMGALIEFLQWRIVNGRQLDYLDQCANTLGISTGIFLAYKISPFKFSYYSEENE